MESHPSAPLRAGSFAKNAKHGAPAVRGGSGRQQVPHRAFCPVRNDKGLFGLAEVRALAAYNYNMRQPIRVDNSRPMTVYDTARILGVSKKRTEAIIREVERTIHRDPKTGKIVIRTKGWENTPGNHSSRNGRKTSKTGSARRKASR